MRATSYILAPIIMACAVSSAAVAADDATSLRLKIVQVPGADTWEFESTEITSGSGLEGEADLDAQTGMGITLAINARHIKESGFGYAYEAGLFYRSHEGESGGDTGELTAYGVELGIDLAYALPSHKALAFTAGPRVGFGVGDQDEGSDSEVESGIGYYLSYGVQAEAAYTISDKFVIGATLGWMGFTATAQRDMDPSSGFVGTADITYSGSGATYGLLVGYQF
jgi:hypothetical protein